MTDTEKLPTPRMNEVAEGPTFEIVSAGTSWLSRSGWVMPALVMSAPPTTLIAIAAFCELSDLRWAVTIISLRPVVSVAGAVEIAVDALRSDLLAVSDCCEDCAKAAPGATELIAAGVPHAEGNAAGLCAEQDRPTNVGNRHT